MSEVVKFYDGFTELQREVGINNRHVSILTHLEKSGLKRNHKVLEVGCGIGTVSELILRHLSTKGFLHAVDISPKSIELAKIRLRKYTNATLEVKDLTKEIIEPYFDVVLLPDVIEHIPIELHDQFFTNMYKLLSDTGFIFIHIPHPNNLEWMVNNKHKGLQIIDQPIHTDSLCATVYPIGFYIHYLKSYSIYCVDNDYQIVVLKKKPTNQNFDRLQSYFNLPLHKRLQKKLRYILRGFK